MARLFPGKSDLPATSDSAAKRVGGALATHALAFQITSLGRGGKRLQRVVGVHPVRDCTADLLHDLFWETVEHLGMYAGVSVAAAVCDGASANRLFIKMNTTDLEKDTPNHFMQAWCPNLVQPWRKLFFISDPAHALKKPANNWEKSTELGCRNLLLPEPIVRAILSQVHQPLAAQMMQTRAQREQQQHAASIGAIAARTEGEEAFIYLMGRIYEHLTDQKPYMAKTTAAIEKDARVVELRFLLNVLRAWHTYNATVGVGQAVGAKDRASWGLSHQLFFDLQLEIEGFLGLLHDQIERHDSVCLQPRKLSQDTLESLFGCLRYACGGGNHPELMGVVRGTRPAEDRIAAKRRVSAQRKARMNSGRTDESRTKMAYWEESRATAKRTAAAAALEEVKPKKRERRWHMTEPAGFGESWQRYLQPGMAPAMAHAVSWSTMKAIQDWDMQHFGTRLFHKLTPAHFERTAHSRMNMGIVIDIFSRETARGLRMLRAIHTGSASADTEAAETQPTAAGMPPPPPPPPPITAAQRERMQANRDVAQFRRVAFAPPEAAAAMDVA